MQIIKSQLFIDMLLYVTFSLFNEDLSIDRCKKNRSLLQTILYSVLIVTNII